MIANIQNAIRKFTNCPDTESEQSLIRVAVILAIIAYLNLVGAYAVPTGKLFNIFSWVAFVNALLIVAWIFRQPVILVRRRIYALLSDNAFVSMLMFFGEEKSIVLFTVYLWVTIGYGFRYGVKFLYLSLITSVLLFTSLMIWTDYWGDEALVFSIGILTSMVIIPLYTTKLIHNLRSAIERADRANRAKDRFLATVSHEMRTPLNGIKGYIGLMKKEQLSPKTEDYLELIELSANNLHNDINNILDISKIEAGQMTVTSEPVNLKFTVETEIAALKPLAYRKGLELSIFIDPELPDIVGTDEVVIRRIVRNIVSNSIKFTTKGKISIELTTEQRDSKKLMVRFLFRDTGIGVPRESIDQLFIPFTQLDSGVDRKYEGTGLGLSIVKDMVTKLGGNVTLDSKLDEYTVVTVEVPVAVLNGKKIQRSAILARETAYDVTGARALVVDDNEINRSLLKALLESFGFLVDTAESGTTAIELFGRNTYQIAFIDIHMPRLDGIETTNKIKTQYSGELPPIVAVTADLFGLRNGEFGEAEFDAVLTKPIDEDSLSKILAKYFSQEDRIFGFAEANVESSENQTDILDRKRGLEFASGSEELWRRSVERFLERTSVQLEQLAETLRAQDFPAVSELAHFMKGSTQYIAADSFSRCVERLEEFSRRRSFSECATQLDLLKEEFRKLRTVFNKSFR